MTSLVEVGTTAGNEYPEGIPVVFVVQCIVPYIL